jgi:prepilin-type N-terminal cleavage/methylation domain-containing protein/prepilin-type processing-associated H-X9-DG protein
MNDRRPKLIRIRCHRPGFTLVELLVVVAIVAVLSSLLLSAITLVRDAARTSKCMANLRQMQIANLAYASDWDGFYVPYMKYNFTTSTSSYFWWQNPDFIDKITGGEGTMFPVIPPNYLCPLSQPGIPVRVGLSYGGNDFHSWSTPPQIFNGFHTATLKHPGAKVAFLDALGPDLGYTASNPNNYWINGIARTEGGVQVNVVAYRHHDRTNAVWFDGHVTTSIPGDIFRLEVWDPDH